MDDNKTTKSDPLTMWAGRHPGAYWFVLALVFAGVLGFGIFGITQGHVIFSAAWMLAASTVIGCSLVSIFRDRQGSIASGLRLIEGHSTPSSLAEAKPKAEMTQVPGAKGRALSAAIFPMPFALFFWIIDLTTPQNPIVFPALGVPAVGLSMWLAGRGDSLTQGWRSVHPADPGLASQTLSYFGHRRLTYAAHRSGLPPRRLETLWYVSVGSLVSAWLFLMAAGFLFGDNS